MEAAIAGTTYRFDSKLEHTYAILLEHQRRSGQIEAWEFHPEAIQFEKHKHGVTQYVLDFKVTHRNGTVEWVECKGYIDARSATRVRRFCQYRSADELVLVMRARPTPGKSKASRASFERFCRIQKLGVRIEYIGAFM